ncbi:MAG: PKD domain-containing protein, partial [Acidimicrobiales bacterium]
LDAASGQIEATQVLPADTEFRLFVEDGLVWFDNPAGPEAGVLKRDGSVVPVDKSQDGLPLLRAGASGPANGQARAPAPKLAPEAELRLLPSSALEAGIETSPTPAEVGEPITFTGSARGEPAPTSWRWTFDDGETAEGVIVRKAFAEPGLHQVTLTVANGQRNASTTAAVTVVDGREQLTARFTTSTDSAAVGEPVVFEDRSLGEVTERSWSFGDGAAAPSARRVVHRFQAAGAYTVGLEVRGLRGAVGAERTITIRERPPPLTAAAEATPRRAPVGQAVTFTDRSEPAPAQSVWSFDDGARASGRVVRHAFATEGEHTATLRARSEAGEVSVATVTVLVVAPSAPHGEIAASSVQARPGAPITFSLVNLSGGPTSVVWSWGDGATTPAAPGAAVTKAWTAPGTYPVTASLTNSAGEFTASLSVRIVPPPGSEARFAAAPNPAAPGQAVRFSDRSTGAPTAWRWSFGDGAASTERNPVHAFAGVGVFDVSLEVVGADGKTSRTSEKVTVRTTPRPPPSASLAVTTAPDQRIAGRPITFTDTTPGAVGTARWRFEPGGEADGRTVTRTFPNPGTVEVTLRSCWADEPTICAAVVDRIEVLPAPLAPPNVVIRRLSPDPAPPGAPVSLADATAGAVGGHTWTVAGRTREGRVLTVSFPAAGDYPVRLRVCRTDQPTVCGETTIVVHVRERVGG